MVMLTCCCSTVIVLSGSQLKQQCCYRKKELKRQFVIQKLIAREKTSKYNLRTARNELYICISVSVCINLCVCIPVAACNLQFDGHAQFAKRRI